MINNSHRKSNKLKFLTVLPLIGILVFFFCCNQMVNAISYYENEALAHPQPGQIFQACIIDDTGMITLENGEKVTVDEMKAIVVERRRVEGDIITKEKVKIVEKEAMNKVFKMVK